MHRIVIQTEQQSSQILLTEDQSDSSCYSEDSLDREYNRVKDCPDPHYCLFGCGVYSETPSEAKAHLITHLCPDGENQDVN